jgi:hypothetical protein
MTCELKSRPQKPAMDAMSIEQLREAKKEQLSMKIGWDRKGYGKELQWRERDHALTKSAVSSTLYDLWG